VKKWKSSHTAPDRRKRPATVLSQKWWIPALQWPEPLRVDFMPGKTQAIPWRTN